MCLTRNTEILQLTERVRDLHGSVRSHSDDRCPANTTHGGRFQIGLVGLVYVGLPSTFGFDDGQTVTLEQQS